jgi:hypothetical protein
MEDIALLGLQDVCRRWPDGGVHGLLFLLRQSTASTSGRPMLLVSTSLS